MKRSRLLHRYTVKPSVAGYLLVITSAACLSYILGIYLIHRQSAVWTAPYLSAAANLQLPPDFRINPKQVAAFTDLQSVWQQDNYRFTSSEPLSNYRSNDIGYAYLIWFAEKLFPSIGQQAAIILLQITVHLLICLYLLTHPSLPEKWKRYFLWLYAVNPILLLYVTYSHYYFWQVLPAFAVIILASPLLHPSHWAHFAVVLTLPWAILARSTTLLLLPLLIILLYRNMTIGKATLSTTYLVLVLFYFQIPSQKNPWHTAYIGVGAYQNEWGIRLSDNSGHKLALSLPDLIPDISEAEWVNSPGYRSAARDTFFQQITHLPLLYIKNALINTLLSFGSGYFNGGKDRTNYLLSLTGLFTIWVLVTRRSWLILIAILLTGIGFTPYYPPVPAYMYGHYLLIICGLLSAWYLPPEQDMPHRILYLSLNDGSDTRINKEVKTLTNRRFQVEFMGIGLTQQHCFVKDLPISRLYIIRGSRKSAVSLVKYFGRAVLLLLSRKYHSVHVVNEAQLAVLWPFLILQRWVVADIFDSIFLRLNRVGPRWRYLKKALYYPTDRIIVTDINRLSLLPKELRKKSVVLPNYPPLVVKPGSPQVRSPSDPLTILYYGWLGKQRGSHLVEGLINTARPIQILMAGWIADESVTELIQRPQVQWHGTIPQDKSHHLASTCDFILCVYAPVNDNNINASPNKIFDAIQQGKPVITNAEIVTSRFVGESNLGIVLPDYYHIDYSKLYDTLIEFRKNYHPDPALRTKYCWEDIGHVLLNAHQV